MNFLANHTYDKILKGDALIYSSEASNAKSINKNVINATIGTFLYEDGSFETSQSLKKAINNLTDKEKFSYSTSDGGKDYINASVNYYFNESLKCFDDFAISGMATPGGTGAISCSVYLSLDNNQTLLIPSPCWGPYKGIAKNACVNSLNYNLIKDSKFDLDDFKEKCLKVAKEENKVVVLLNDPCHNPVGYSLSIAEFKAIIDFFNTLDVCVNLVLDLAYLDISSNEEDKRAKLELLSTCNKNVMVLACLSYSKSFFIYGSRIGCLLMFGKDKEAVKDFYNHATYFARNTWSNCNHEVISAITKVTNDKELTKIHDKELINVQNTLIERSNIFIKEAEEVGLKTLPYKEGFFISIPCQNSFEIAEKLHDDLVYLLPIDGILRVAVCGISKQECCGLAAKIIKYIK